MLWLLMLHIAALVLWCATLIYLPVLLAVPPQAKEACSQPDFFLPSIQHFIFTHIATPFALATIVFGTLLFMVTGTTEPWLIVKLSAVTALVVCHALLGLLILRTGRADLSPAPNSEGTAFPTVVRIANYTLLAAIVCLVVAILWLVLSKPTLGWF